VNAGVASPLPNLPGLVNQPIGHGTADFTTGPAMDAAGCRAARELGRGRIVGRLDLDAVVLGEMGIGNTTSAAALMAAYLGLAPEICCGRGTGIDHAGWERKVGAVRAGLAGLGPDRSPTEILAYLGGYEIAALVGVIEAAAPARIPVVVDGFIATAAALAAVRIDPSLASCLIFAHRGSEQGHHRLLMELEAQPLLDLGLRLGEGTGGVLALHLLRAACRLLDEMATFDGAGVSEH